jgi:hypothetical protein
MSKQKLVSSKEMGKISDSEHKRMSATSKFGNDYSPYIVKPAAKA